MSSPPTVSTEAAGARNYPSHRFNERERKLIKIVKTYVDAAAGETLTANSVSIGNSSNVAIDVDTTVASSASKIRAVVKSATFTVTIASPGVATSAAHGLLNGDAVVLSTTGALPTGLAVATTYYVVNKNTNTFELSATVGGASINTTGSQSGTHTQTSSGLSLAPLTVNNADVAAAAGIALSKLEALASARLVVGSSANVATAVDVTGDVTIGNTGVTAIATGVIINTDVNASAAIDFSKLAALSSANILVGNGSNVAVSVAMSGDTTISNAGVVAIGAGKVLESMVGVTTGQGLFVRRIAKGIYNTAAGFGAGAHTIGATVPTNSYVNGAWYWVKTTFTSASDAATLAISLEGANDIVSAIAISDGSNPWDTTSLPVEGIPKIETTSTWLKTTQSRALTVTTATETITDGVMHVWLEYLTIE